MRREDRCRPPQAVATTAVDASTVRGKSRRAVPASIEHGGRPSECDLFWAIPKLALPPAAKFLLMAAFWHESKGEFREITASNASLAAWAGMVERSVRTAKGKLEGQGYIEFMYRSRGKADTTGQQTDVFRVRWRKVFEDANAEFERREARTRSRRHVREECAKGEGFAPSEENTSSSPPQKGEQPAAVGAGPTANSGFTKEEQSDQVSEEKSRIAPRVATPSTDSEDAEVF